MAECITTDRLVDTSEAARVLGIKKQTLDVWRCTGRYSIPFVKVGRLVRYRTSDLEAFLNDRTVKNTAEAGELSSRSQ